MSDEAVTTGENRNPDGTFKAGVSGNPNGRPPGSVSIMSIIKKKLQEAPPGQIKPLAELIAEQILEMAYVGKSESMLKEVLHYIDGMPSQKINIGADKEDVESLTDFLKVLGVKTKADENDRPQEPVGEGTK